MLLFVKSANPPQSFLTLPWVLITMAGTASWRPRDLVSRKPAVYPFQDRWLTDSPQPNSPRPPGILPVLPMLPCRTEEIWL